MNSTEHLVIPNTHAWFVKAGQMPKTPAPDVRQSAFYTGMQAEELAEKLAAILPGHPVVNDLEALGLCLKDGTYDDAVRAALRTPAVAELMLDGDMDLIWVSIGAAYAGGADCAGAYAAVLDANWAKFPGGVVNRDPATGKVLKPEGWKAPDLTEFLPAAGSVK